MYKLILNFIISAIIVMPCISNANADKKSTNFYPEPRKTSKDCDATLGLGLGLGPRYEGSSKFDDFPVPYFEVVWKDIVTLDNTGLNFAVIHNNKYEAGIGLAYDDGRDEKYNFNPFGDKHVSGVKTVNPSVGIRTFALYNIEPFELNGSVTRFLGQQNDGVVVSVGGSVTLPLNNKIIITPRINANWANENYMQTYFGISEHRAAISQYKPFHASAGLKDIELGVNTIYMLDDTQHWFLSEDVLITQLLSDAAGSPITESNIGATFITMLGYHF